MQRSSAFTAGWEASLDLVDSLPIKRGGKVVRTSKVRVVADSGGADTSEEEEDGDEEGEQAKAKEAEETRVPVRYELMIEGASIDAIKVELADICTAVLANPQSALFKGRGEEREIIKGRKLSELFAYLESHPNAQVCELAMLSMVVLLRDICPGYCIRVHKEDEATLKKETKKLFDFERSLLRSYQRFITYLERKVKLLGRAGDATVLWTAETRYALSALRCMCELLRALPYFNFRSQLLQVVVARAAQPVRAIADICVETIASVFKADANGEVSYEMVRMVASALLESKYIVSPEFLGTLEHVKLAVHADQAKGISRQRKKDKRARKKAGDDVLDGLAEGDLKADKLSAQKFQTDSLHEVCLIYFRIIKLKIGFDLLPSALGGLSRITHLINVETVEDIVVLMRGLLDSTAMAVTPTVRVLCVHCALKTLAGPGEILNYDSEVFVTAALEQLTDVYGEGADWALLLECVDLILLKRREARNEVVLSFVRLLLMHTCHVPYNVACTVLCMVNSVLLRYPRARSSFKAIGLVDIAKQREEEEVGDMAMAPLKAFMKTSVIASDDGSWACALLCSHIDTKVQATIHKVVSKSIVTSLPVRLAELPLDALGIADRAESILLGLPSTKLIKSNTLNRRGNKQKSRKNT